MQPEWFMLPPAGLGDSQDRLGQLAMFFNNRHGYIFKTSIFVKVVCKLFQFKKIIVSEPGLRFSLVETFSESGGLPSGLTSKYCKYKKGKLDQRRNKDSIRQVWY